ncbi:MAG: Na+/H+ antiporter NhaC, partial [Tissierellia bacterium]|nr:Na+/H+ antiporter NhaC [Tissierellia bacterium]
MKARKPHIYEAVTTFVFLIIVMGVGIAKFKADPHVPMLIGAAFAALMALRLGYKWKDIEGAMIGGITQALQSVIILAIIGVLIGVWILSGVVPAMIYYGLSILKPSIFLVATLLICSITSLATGTSWGTIGTIGIALMGVAKGLGIPIPIAAGAIISGAYFGDKMPPLVVIILVAKRVPAIPGIFVGVILGMIFAPIFQGANFGDILSSSY